MHNGTHCKGEKGLWKGVVSLKLNKQNDSATIFDKFATIFNDFAAIFDDFVAIFFTITSDRHTEKLCGDIIDGKIRLSKQRYKYYTIKLLQFTKLSIKHNRW